jgi:CRP-like cAMP-binding protein
MVEAKKKILKEIITSEEATLLALKRLVESAKLFLKVEEKTGRVIISPNFKFTNADKIFLILLGKYFAKHYEILKDFTVTLSDISMEIGIKRTTLSAPLKRLVDDDVVSRPRENTYRINPYKAEHLLHRMNEKYLSGESK